MCSGKKELHRIPKKSITILSNVSCLSSACKFYKNGMREFESHPRRQSYKFAGWGQTRHIRQDDKTDLLHNGYFANAFADQE